MTGLPSPGPCLLFLGDERRTVPGVLRQELLPPPGEQGSFQAALASPEEFAPPAAAPAGCAGEIAETPDAFLTSLLRQR